MFKLNSKPKNFAYNRTGLLKLDPEMWQIQKNKPLLVASRGFRFS
jgi:hypothetical protein